MQQYVSSLEQRGCPGNEWRSEDEHQQADDHGEPDEENDTDGTCQKLEYAALLAEIKYTSF
ncbi:hypothetical protein [Billgrantia antri]|uniref:Uncharacterized protein n=1 Tax=Billgrantia antri TaxID=2846777 RepID=A0ABS6ZSC6_9GAMM|nr:hypothetical protein [Halomonas antri]MBW6391804.1 hypothetical protein [Halomonas antri]